MSFIAKPQMRQKNIICWKVFSTESSVHAAYVQRDVHSASCLDSNKTQE